MRIDDGLPCPETLGEYYDISSAILGKDSPAVKFLEDKIKIQGRDMKVIAPDSQMRYLLLSMHGEKKFEERVLSSTDKKSHTDSTGAAIKVGDTVKFRGEIYTIKSFMARVGSIPPQ